MSSDTLSKITLSFNDPDLKEIYKREKIEFFNKVVPIIGAMMLFLAGTLEILYRVIELGTLPKYISLINWIFLLVIFIIGCLHRNMTWMHTIICPGLTALTFLYLSFVDYDYSMGSIYYSLIIGFTLCLFILVIFNEAWLISTLVYAPFLSYYMYKTGYDLLGSEVEELAMRCVFCILIYATIAYQVESLRKQSFMGRESSEKAFHRWMKIFETFPEGISLVRNNYIMYANRALKYILNVGVERNSNDDPLYELLKDDLKISIVTQWQKNQPDKRKKEEDTAKKEISIWNFLMNNEKGAIFQLMPKRRPNADGSIDVLNEYLKEIPKYITLNQVNVRIAGGTDKLLVVRDVTSIVLNEQIMETKREMSKMTEQLMKQLDEHARRADEKMDKLEQLVSGQGAEFVDECKCEIKKIQFRVKDFQQVYNINENKFRPTNENVNIKKCFNEIDQMAKYDCKGKNLDYELVFTADVPATIQVDINKIKQVVLNLFSQSVRDKYRGSVKIVVGYLEPQSAEEPPYLTIDIENSKFEVKSNDARRLSKFSEETKFSKLLESKVDLNYKIAKILSNALGWKIEFNAFKSGKQTIMIPISSSSSNTINIQENIVVQPVPAQQMVREFVAERPAIDLPVITEEKPGATGTNETDEQIQYKPAENYPLRQPKSYSEVLLVSYSDIKAVLQQKIGFKCDECYMEDGGMEKIQQKIRDFQDKGKPFYKYVIVNLDEVTIIIERFGRSIKRVCGENKIKLDGTKFYAFSSINDEKIEMHCKKGGFRFYLKAGSKAGELDLFRHMANEEDFQSQPTQLQTPNDNRTKVVRSQATNRSQSRTENPDNEANEEE